MKPDAITRRLSAGAFLLAVALSMPVWQSLGEESQDLVQSIERVTLHRWRDGQATWFLPRVTPMPGKNGIAALMTLQEITGSDYYGPVHWRESNDEGKTWSAPQTVPGFGRKKYSALVCACWPEGSFRRLGPLLVRRPQADDQTIRQRAAQHGGTRLAGAVARIPGLQILYDHPGRRRPRLFQHVC